MEVETWYGSHWLRLEKNYCNSLIIENFESDNIIYKVILVVQSLWGDKLLCKACNSLPDRCRDVVPPFLPQDPLVKPGCRLWLRLGGEEGTELLPMRQTHTGCWEVGGWSGQQQSFIWLGQRNCWLTTKRLGHHFYRSLEAGLSENFLYSWKRCAYGLRV